MVHASGDKVHCAKGLDLYNKLPPAFFCKRTISGINHVVGQSGHAVFINAENRFTTQPSKSIAGPCPRELLINVDQVTFIRMTLIGSSFPSTKYWKQFQHP